MTDIQIIEKVKELCDGAERKPLVVFTGGEPTILKLNNLIYLLHKDGFELALETNGTLCASWLSEIDFVTISPKFEFCKNAAVVLGRCNELKVVYDGKNNLELYNHIKADHYYLQPCDTGNQERNKEIIEQTIAVCKRDPKWRISIQTQKILKIL